MKTVLYPSFYPSFACIGSECEDSCCGGWRIRVDKKSYIKYRAVKDPAFQALARTALRRNRGADRSDNIYAEINLDAQGNCPFLDENALCSIQKQLGPDALCNTCRDFPRKSLLLTPAMAQLALSNTCPAVLKLLLFNEEPLSYVQKMLDELPPATHSFVRRFTANQQSLFADTPLHPHLFALHSACIDIMQARRYSVAERIFILGLMLKQAAEGGGDGCEAVITRYVGLAGSDVFAGQLPPATDTAVKQAMYTVLFNTIFLDVGCLQMLAAPMVNHMGKEAVQRTSTRELFDRALALEEERKDKYFRPFVENRPYVLENYFVNEMAYTAFPFALFHKDEQPASLQHQFIFLAIQYALLRLFLCISLDENDGITDALLLRILARLSRRATASGYPINVMRQYAKNGLDTPAHAVFLLR